MTCTRLPFEMCVRFEMQPWILVNKAYPAFYLTRYIQYLNIVTYGEVRISKLRLTSFMKMLLYRILTSVAIVIITSGLML